jgi:hypothetical protein
MAIADKIHGYIQRLPEPLQAEVLDFVEYLLYKVERAEGEGDDQDWSALSLSLAMRGMEDEETPEYTLEDLKETF